ncbi:bifunctional hydroxymethylpyrimidine kinase/phosphomethylpyrimidine kinase [Planomicrobium sp. CPCC 101110]|uniref:bifunctional hydroxymethylpyrimidine kinase/phosphomethylpyrimidine kinase n=1 Tax=Planomicrobium sp. CPCC 101110 TaxID=2599619 RepID=UPI0011B6D9FB|nr:bifunctional hydroxymethylpyrimidine kinase/phosphomethylpyrimidine kinase [Planomicrobium sp. CPCC 101110]TWT27367.1 bifunctional hydroxymethylpyrimidine kinase/phosphomethylpyrimidine kinase [Planomicrobium sp. CPCC 101110]
MSAIPQVLTIAGSDSGGGAGIQADIKTFQELGVYSTSAITAVTAQNTLGVDAIYPMTREAVRSQLQAIGRDFQVAALKTGMLFSAEIIEETVRNIKQFGWAKVVVDPVMIAKGGAALLQQEAVEAVKEHLLPLATIVTPNIPEAEALCGMAITDEVSRRKAAEKILSFGAESAVIKGGHGADPHVAEDFYLHSTGESFIFRTVRIETTQTHGTGCTFAAAVAAELAKGKTAKEAIHVAKQFIQAALTDSLHIGAGHGPTNHAAYKAGLQQGNRGNGVEILG